VSRSLTFTIPGDAEAEAFKKKIRDEALARGISMSEYVVEALAAYMRKKNGD